MHKCYDLCLKIWERTCLKVWEAIMQDLNIRLYQNECCLQIIGITLNFPVLNNHGKTHSFSEDMGWNFFICKDDFHNK